MNDLPLTQPTGGRTRSRRARAMAAVVVVLVLIAGVAVFIVSRPSDSASPGVASVGPTSTVSSRSSSQSGATPTTAAAYSACMRSNGVPTFPDPDSQGRLMLKVTTGDGNGLNPNSPQFQAAAKACKHLAPSQTSSASTAGLSAQGLKYAICMRSHGVPSFPDPQVSDGHFMMQLPKGINANSPQFQSAQQACRSLMPGGDPGSGQ